MEKTCYIYGLRPKDSTDYFYVGSTKLLPAERLKQHLDFARLGYNKNKHFVSKLNQIGFDSVVSDALEKVSPDARFDREYIVISEMLKRGVKLANIIISSEDRSRYGERRKQQEYEDMVCTPEWFLPRIELSLIEPYPAKAQNPRDQALCDKFGKLIFLYLKHILLNCREDFQKMMSVSSEYVDDLIQRASKHPAWPV